MWVGITILTSRSQSLEGSCYGNRFVERIGENWHTHLHSVRRLSTTDGKIRDARVNTTDDPTDNKNLVNFSPVTPEFCRRVST